jgi:hypothetical protein
VRTIKGLRRKISRGRASKPIPGRDSKTVGSNIFQEQKRLLDKSSRKPQSQPSKKAAPKKDTSQYKDVSPPKEKKMPEKKILENKKGSSE